MTDSRNSCLVSVIIPTYNRAHVLCHAVDSVLAQTYPEVEVIVVDDGSTDGTGLVLRHYGSRVRVLRQPNAGPAAARNLGVRHSRGDVLAFLDSDDIWAVNRLEVQMDILLKAGSSVPCCLCDVRLESFDRRISTSFIDSQLFPETSAGVWLNPFEVLTTRFVFFNQAALVRRVAFDKLQGFDERLRYLEDYDLALRLSRVGPWAFVSEPLVMWRQGFDSLSREAMSGRILLKECELGIRNRLLSSDSKYRLSGRQRRLMERALGRNRRELAAIRLGNSNSVGVRIAARVLKKYGWIRAAIVRRSFWYPRMRATSLKLAENSVEIAETTLVG